jgi:hypothetical protein
MRRVAHHAGPLLILGALFVVFAAPSSASAVDEIVGMWTAALTGYQIRVTQTGVHRFAGAAVKAYMLGPCTNKAGRVVWKQVAPIRPGHYNGTFAGYAFMTQDPSTCNPNYTAPMTATIGAPSGGKLWMRVYYLPGGCRIWTRPYTRRPRPRPASR